MPNATCPDCGTRLACPHCRAVAAASHTSEAKATAARRNGKKGGWPKGRRRKEKKMEYLVIGTLENDPGHEFGEYDSLREAKRVWAGHDGIDGPVKILDADTRMQVWPLPEDGE